MAVAILDLSTEGAWVLIEAKVLFQLHRIELEILVLVTFSANKHEKLVMVQ
jgi:hypothetical protein